MPSGRPTGFNPPTLWPARFNTTRERTLSRVRWMIPCLARTYTSEAHGRYSSPALCPYPHAAGWPERKHVTRRRAIAVRARDIEEDARQRYPLFRVESSRSRFCRERSAPVVHAVFMPSAERSPTTSRGLRNVCDRTGCTSGFTSEKDRTPSTALSIAQLSTLTNSLKGASSRSFALDTQRPSAP